MTWIKSIRDLVVDVTLAVGLEISALIDDWRAER